MNDILNAKSLHIGLVDILFVFIYGLTVLLVNNIFNIVPILLFFISISYLVKNKIPLKNSNLNLIYFVFLIYCIPIVASIIFSYSRMSYLDYPSRFLLFLPVGYFLSVRKIRWDWLLYGFMLGSFILLIGLGWKWSQGNSRPMFWAHWNIISEVATGIFCLAFMFYEKGTSTRQVMLAVLTQVLSVSIILISSSRGSLLAILCVTLSYGLISVLLFKREKKMYVLLLLLLLMVPGSVFFGSGISARISQGYNNASSYFSDGQKYTSVGYRFELWGAAVSMIKEKPVLGYGNVGSYERLKQMVAEGVVDSFVLSREHHHSDYIEATVTRGGLGLFSTLLFYLVPLGVFLRHIRSAPQISVPASLFVVSYMVCSLAEVPLWNGFTLMFYFSMVTMFASQLPTQEIYDEDLSSEPCQ